MDTIIIRELAVAYRVGITDAERASPQKLLLNLEISHDCAQAAARDDLTHTIDYLAVCQHLLSFGEGRSWKLIESLAVDIATVIRSRYRAAAVVVEVQKFVIPETRYVAVRITRP
jgi:7,8-dihydroneopterin aldolase/epimerase/oxygenase